MGNRLEKFRAKSKEFTLSGDDKPLTISGLTFPELADFATLVEDKKTKDALNFLLFRTLRKALPTKEENPAEGITDDEVRNEMSKMASGIALELIKYVKEISNIPGEDPKKKD